jgi:2-polyprenyl-3-methyl-5-hydroxy-6-metoxy-1,4-benzoquinol methylase
MTKDQLLKATRSFITRLEDIDRNLRQTMKLGMKVPKQAKDDVMRAFSKLHTAINRYNKAKGGQAEGLKRKCRAILTPWLFRSDYFNRSFHKPHGYGGDYRIIEWIYDLKANPGKEDPCNDPTQPAIVNCLNHVFSQLPSVKSAWDRRKYFADLMIQEYNAFAQAPQNRPFRILDVACGGTRYTSDFLAAVTNPGNIEVTLVDQDRTALEYCRTQSLSGRSSPGRLERHCFPIKHLAANIKTGEFDVVVSAGLFDYLPDTEAAALLAHMVKLTRPGGVTAVANFHTHDPTKTVLIWLVDWVLIYRTQANLAKLFPKTGTAIEEKIKSGEIAYVRARRTNLPKAVTHKKKTKSKSR